jgi:glyoxylase-like metal-dependent hydrolase (beta-lactamase superfamily II)
MSEEAVGGAIEQTRVAVELGTEAEPLLIRFSIAPPPTGISSFDSYALRTEAGWIFVDPVQPTRDAAERLACLIRARPVATVLTSDCHERFCYAVREQWGAPVWGPTPGAGQRPVEYRGKPDHLYAEGGALPGGLRAIRLVGLARGDHALLWAPPDGGRFLFTGDVLNGQVETDLARADHYRCEPGIYFGSRPRYVERHANPAALKASLERLLREEFDVIAGSHSRPFRDDPKTALAQLTVTV